MADVDLRLLRYFVAVAEERSFTRAAEGLQMTQPALSRAVRALEDLVGAPLLIRGYRDVSLTEAGRVLLHHARDIDEQATAAIRLAAHAATAAPRLRVTAPGWDVALQVGLVSAFNRGKPAIEATPLVVDRWEQARHLRNGMSDVALMRTPAGERGLDSDEYVSEPRVALLREDDPLVGRRGLHLRQLAGIPILRRAPDHDDGFLFWPPDAIRSDWWTAGPVVGDTSQITALVRLGAGVALVPSSVVTTGPGVRAVRVLDCPPSTARLVWDEGSTSRAVADLVRLATTPEAESPITVST